MSVSVGDKLGPYEIVAFLGKGGMGSVYRAHDGRLRRDVAIKVCSERFSERFTQEARTIAALNHPNVCTLYDIGPDYLVMELIDGVSPRGPLSEQEALGIAAQVAAALAAAHERGIIHRDLKPANVKITPEGLVKVLDFGVAKQICKPTADASTLTMVTEPGLAIGTPAYMAPEQAQGKEIDTRADVWAFGVMLYELLSGQSPFRGDSVASTLAAVLNQEPDLTKFPPRVRPLLRACLKKDARERLSSIVNWGLLLDQDGLAQPAVPATRSKIPWVVAAMAGILAVIAFWAPRQRDPRPSISEPLMRIDADLGAGVSLFTENGPALALSRDGTRVVFSSRREDGSTRLFWRRLDQANVTPLPGTDSGFAPFFSPSGEQIAFFANGSLKKIELATGNITVLANAVNPAGGTWGEDDMIVFNRAPTLDLWKVPANGGEMKPVPRAASTAGRYWPQLLPGGKALLITRVPALGGDVDQESIDALSVDDGHTQTLVEGAHFGRYLPNGYLAYLRRGTLFARAFDVAHQKLNGPEFPVLQGVDYSTLDGAGQLDVASNGTLLFRTAPTGSELKTVQWLDGDRLEPLLGIPGDYRAISLSPDGKRLALVISDTGGSDLYVYDVERRQQPARLTVGANVLASGSLTWMPDGRYLLFSAGASTWWVPTEGLSQPRELLRGFNVNSISHDGNRLFVTTVNSSTRTDTWIAPLSVASDGPHVGQPTPLLRGIYSEVPFDDSPDGRWLSYAADETGVAELYVTEIANPSRKWLLSTASGQRAFWEPSGREILFATFFAPIRIMIVSYSLDKGHFQPDQPRAWSRVAIPDHAGFSARSVAMSPDGKRVAVLMPAETPLGNRVTFVSNFFDEVRRRAAGVK
jgi:serine/threonine-protein kinase